MSPHLALIINPDPERRAGLRRIVEAALPLESVELDSGRVALDWLEKSDRKVSFVLDGWELGNPAEDFSRRIRAKKASSAALHFRIASSEDHGWLTALFHTPGLIEAAFQPSMRVSLFAQMVKQKIAVDPRAKPTALLVDDDDEARAIVKQYLIGFGFSQVVEARNGEQALECLAKQYRELSLIVSDWAMPGMTGIELLRQVHLKPWLARLPFVMVTSATPLEPIKTLQAAQMGVCGYLLKPFNSKTFHSQMDGILHEVHKQRQAEAYLLTGRVVMAQGDSFRAEEAFHEGLTLYPNEALLWEAMGDAQVMKARENKNLTPAIDSYERALKLNPANVAGLMKYFEVASAVGRTNEAVRVLRSHLHRSDLEDTLRTRLGKVFLENGDYQGAQDEFRRALAHNPGNQEAKRLFDVTLSMEVGKKQRKAG